ncbi:MAG: hypothetical protein M1827_003282 [Pycnora praestabilis]|nr:MAG: hypothetical protein M1827_003282 [Pycnora praestabilis]
MGRDDQNEEREVLYSIFPDEITAVLLLQVTYPEAYPDEAPQLDLSAPPNSSKYAHLDVQEDRARLMEALQPIIEENMGMAMIFTLVSTLKDSAELLISERLQAAQAVKDVEKAKAEEEENRKFHGEAVTRESFLKWRTDFRRELEEEEQRRKEDKELEDKKKRGPKEEKKMSGRTLWEKGLVGKIEEGEEDEDALEEIEKLKVEA